MPSGRAPRGASAGPGPPCPDVPVTHPSDKPVGRPRTARGAARRRPRSPRWRRLPEERPGQIIEAALAVFGDRGLAGARLDDIAARAGISKGTIYLYFPNKEELFREVVRTVVVGRIEAAARTLGTEAPAATLRRFLHAQWAFVRSREFQTISRLVLGELHDFPDLAAFYGREVVTPATELLATVIRRGIDAGVFRDVEPRLAARTLCSMLITQAMWCERRTLFHVLTDVTDEQVLEQITDLFFHALRREPAPAAGAPARA